MTKNKYLQVVQKTKNRAWENLTFNFVQEKSLYDMGIKLDKSQPAHFVAVFNKQKARSKDMSKYAYATLHASSLLSKQ